VRQATKERAIDYPVALDNDYGVWRAFDNNYWPALYFIDEDGAKPSTISAKDGTWNRSASSSSCWASSASSSPSKGAADCSSSFLKGVDLVCSTKDSSAVTVAERIRRARPKILGSGPDEQDGVRDSLISDDELTDRWERQELGGTGVSHIDHVRVGWVLHRRYGAAEAEERLVEGTRKGCDSDGVPEKFDERLTRLWARAISDAAGTGSELETFDEFIWPADDRRGCDRLVTTHRANRRCSQGRA
jgi:hypothetical protein